MKGLFKVSRDVKINDWVFKIVGLEDKELYEKYFATTEYPMTAWSNDFTYIYTHNESNTKTIMWIVVDEMLCTFIENAKKRLDLYCLPFGGGDVDKVKSVVIKCLSFCDVVNGGVGISSVQGADELQANWLKTNIEDDALKFKKMAFGLEHHYSISKLINLEGKDFAYIRRKINTFKKKYPEAIFRHYDASKGDWEGLMALKKEWNDTAGDKYFRIHDATYFRATVKEHEKLDHLIFVVELNKKIVAMISGGMHHNDSKAGWCYNRNPLNYIDGLSEFIIVQLAHELKALYPTVETMNDGGDGNKKGLRYFKEKFRPIMSNITYSVHMNKKK